MSLPTKTKTWIYNVNNQRTPAGSFTASQRRIKLDTKMAFVGSSIWAVRSSSNGSVANTSDNWNSVADTIEGSGSHAWIVLRNTSLGATYDICFENSSASQDIRIYVAPNGYVTTGLVTTARPATAVVGDEIPIYNSQYAWGANDYSHVWHSMFSDDGECSRMVMTVGGNAVAMLSFEKMSASAGLSVPVANTVVCSTSSGAIVTSGTLYGTAKAVVRANAGVAAAYFTGESYAGQLVTTRQTGQSDLDGNCPLLPIGVASDTAGMKGRYGQLQDIWWGLDANLTGTTYPSDGSCQFAQFGAIVLPWNGTVPLVQ